MLLANFQGFGLCVIVLQRTAQEEVKKLEEVNVLMLYETPIMLLNKYLHAAISW